MNIYMHSVLFGVGVEASASPQPTHKLLRSIHPDCCLRNIGLRELGLYRGSIGAL